MSKPLVAIFQCAKESFYSQDNGALKIQKSIIMLFFF